MATEAGALMMGQAAPYPEALRALVDRLEYRSGEGWTLSLADIVRDHGPDGEVLSRGLTLIVMRCGPDSYNPGVTLRVNHYFPVPPATYDARSWRAWIFGRLADVDTHERCENFILHDSPGSEHVTRPYAPSHGFGQDPYLIREIGTLEDVETTFRGEHSPQPA